MATIKQILITGGTGYLNERLIPLLLDRGCKVQAMVRSPQKLLERPWSRNPALKVVSGDALDRASFIEAGAGCGMAYYLIHSMNAHKRRFAEADRKAAENMVACAERNGLQRLIYLGGYRSAQAGDYFCPIPDPLAERQMDPPSGHLIS
jgi:nucleoside-diphosphate-sugar epimerase